MALQLRGDFDAALQHADEAIRLEPPGAWAGFGWSAKLTTHARAGQVEEARAMLAEPLPPLPGPDDPTPVGVMGRLAAVGLAAGLLGLESEAKEIYPLLAERVHRARVTLFESIILERIVGMLASTLGMWDEAEGHFAEARRVVDTFPNWFDEPNVDFWHGKMLLDRGRPEDREVAIKEIERARAEFERRGMRHDAKVAAELLASLT
jgi:hypothetical protein